MEIQVLRKGNNLVVSSRVIAKELGKQHYNVTRDIENIIKTNPSNLSGQIILSEYEHRGNIYKEYLLTKDAFTLYMFNIQGYNDFKMAYINKFNEMEKQLQEQSKFKLPQTYIEALECLLASEKEKEEQAKQLEEQKPLVQFANKVAGSSDCIDVGTFAKLIKDEGIKLGRNKLFEKLRDMKILMKNNQPYQTYIDREYFIVKEFTYNTSYGEKIQTKTLITGKGQIWLTEKLRNSVDK